MLVAHLTFLLLLLSNLLPAQEASKISSIRKLVEQINKANGYKIKTLDNEDLADKNGSDSPDNGQELKGYYRDGHLKKMVYSVGLSYCMRTYEYYFDDKNLVFVFEKEEDYPEKKDGRGLDNSKLIPAFERRFYLDNNKVILTKTKGRQRMPDPNIQRFLSMLNDLLADLRDAKAK